MMINFLALDLSSRIGYCYFHVEDFSIKSLRYGKLDFKTLTPFSMKYDKSGVENHPYDYLNFTNILTEQFNQSVLQQEMPDIIIIEQTNKGRNRWTQKLLEWEHYSICSLLVAQGFKDGIKYIDTSKWRSILNIKLSLEQKRTNRKIKKEKTALVEAGESIGGMKGKTNTKHLALTFVNEKFKLNPPLKMKDNDIADAICVGYAYLLKEELVK